MKVGSARISENGTINGNPGDQNGKEVMEENFYMHSKGWVGLRMKDPKLALQLAKEMQDACNNRNGGYGQADNVQVVDMAKKYRHMKDIKEPFNGDCGQYVRACLTCVVGYEIPFFYTATEKDVLMKTGLFLPAFEVRSESDCRVGDILVTKTKGHTVVVTEGSVVKPSPNIGVKASETAKGFDKTIAGEYKTIRETEIRDGAGASKKIIAVLGKDSSVKIYGYYTDKWYYGECTIAKTVYAGFIYSKDLRKE